MQSPDHPELQFVEAAGYTSGRPDGKPLWIVVHDMEASETSTRAENTAAYFANPGDGRNVSSHYCADNNSVVQCVLLRDSAWTVGNRPGNNRGINWEYSGFANQTKQQWLDEFGYAMFRQSAPIIRADAAKYGIPLERRTVDELKRWMPGITSHNDLRLAFGGTTHTDPGGNFPWDIYMEIIRGDDMAGLTEKQDKNLAATTARTKAIVYMEDTIATKWSTEHPDGVEQNLIVQAVKRVEAKVDALAIASGIDPAALQAAVEAAVAAQVPAIAKAAVDEQAARLAE